MALDPGGAGGAKKPRRPKPKRVAPVRAGVRPDDRADRSPTLSPRPDDRPVRPTSAYGAMRQKPAFDRAKTLELFARSVAAGQIEGRRGSEALRKLNPNDDEKRLLGDLTKRYSAEVQGRIDPQERIASYLVGPELAKVLPGGTPASEASPKGLALDAALLFPGTLIGKPLRVGGRGVQALRARPAARTIRYGEAVVQAPASPSRITRAGQRAKDKAFEAAAVRADALRASESTVARGVGRAITPFSTRAQVPKQAGKFVRQEATRRRAALTPEIRTIRRVGRGVIPTRGTPKAQAAHFWYAQLPSEFRNAEGLRKLRRLHEEDLRALLAQDVADPRDIEDLGAAINKLDDLIANPVPVDAKVVNALRTVGEDSADIFVRAGVMTPETVAARPGLLARELGLAPTGDEAFIGHRAARVLRQRPSGLPGNVATGRTLRPEGVSKQNRLKRVRSGRVRQNLDVAVEDWQAAQVYEFHNIAKDELGKMGRAFDGAYNPATEVVVNPKGHKIPREFKVDRLEQAAAEGFKAEDVLIRDVEEYLGNYLAEGAAIPALVGKAERLGQKADLRVVPKDVASRYFSQFLPTRILAATPGPKEGARLAGKTADLANDAVYASLIFSNPGYIPANALANTLMAVAQQGLFLPVNLARTTHVLTRAPQRTRIMLRAEIGQGPSATIASETSPLRAIGIGVGRVADEPFRISAWLHEAARLGVISKAKPTLSRRDYARIDDLLTKPEHRATLNEIRDRANQAMIDFERSGSMERALAKRFLFVWSFLRGATRYPARFALDHPIRTAAGAAVAYSQRDEIKDRLADGMPSWLDGSIEAGDVEVGGKTFPRVLPTRSFSPLSTPWEMYGAAIGRPGAQTFGEFLNPGLTSAYRAANKQDSFGSSVPSYREALGSNTERIVPQYGLARDLLNPEPGGLYPEDASREGRLKRALRVFPIGIDPEVAARSRAYERQETITVPVAKPKTLRENEVARIREEVTVARKLKIPLPPVVVGSLRLSEQFAHNRERLRKNLGVEGLTGRQKVAADLEIARKVAPGLIKENLVKQALSRAVTDTMFERISDEIRLAVDHELARRNGFDPSVVGRNRVSSFWEEETNRALEEVAVGR